MDNGDLLARVKQAVQNWQGEAITDLEVQGLITAIENEGVLIVIPEEEQESEHGEG